MVFICSESGAWIHTYTDTQTLIHTRFTDIRTHAHWHAQIDTHMHTGTHRQTHKLTPDTALTDRQT